MTSYHFLGAIFTRIAKSLSPSLGKKGQWKFSASPSEFGPY